MPEHGASVLPQRACGVRGKLGLDLVASIDQQRDRRPEMGRANRESESKGRSVDDERQDAERQHEDRADQDPCRDDA